MKGSQYDVVCYRTEQREERVALKNLRSGEVGYAFGCTYGGDTVQVMLENGEMDSWGKEECAEVNG